MRGGAWTRWAAGVLACVAAWWGGAAPAPASEPWRTGPSVEQQLRMVLDKGFRTEAPLRQAVLGLARSHRVAALVDRRVDPDRKLSLTLDSPVLEEAFRQIAREDGQEITRMGPVVYLGPSWTCARLRTVCALRRQEVERLPTPAARKLLSSARMQWADFATPRQLLAELAEANGLEIAGMDQVPHDLWAGADLPPLALVDRIGLIAIQFDLTFEALADGSRLTLVPVPDDLGIVREYPGGAQPEALARKWAAWVPDGEVRVVGGKIRVRGLIEDHEALVAARTERPPRPARKPPAKQGETRFTISGKKGPVSRLLAELAEKLDLDLRIDKDALERAGISLAQEVAFRVRDATLDEVLEAVLSPASCAFRRQGRIVEVFPAR